MDFKQIKAAFFDFDDTLCVHMQHNRDEADYYKACLQSDWTYFNDGYAKLPGMHPFLKKLVNDGVENYMLSWTTSSASAITKGLWCRYSYPLCFKDFYGVDSKDHKVRFMLQFAAVRDLTPEEILFVDDRPDVRDQAMGVGLQVMSPMEICVMWANGGLES